MKTMNSKPDMIKLMRKIRDKMSLDIVNMGLEQESEFLKRELSELKNKNSRRRQTV